MATYRTQILQDTYGKYWGEIWKDGVLIYQGAKQMARQNAVLMLKRKIDSLNIVGEKIPPYQEPKPQPKFTAEEADFEIEKAQPLHVVTLEPKVEAQAEAKPTPKPTTPTKPKRKPFTPYGLNGYLVDKHGNARLHLDRKANAQTIVLTPEMFRALAGMVERTFSQGSEQ